MPAGLIEDKHHMYVISGFLAYKPKMMIHVVGVYCRGYHGRRFAVYGIDRCKYIDPFIFGLLDSGWTRTLLSPYRC
jgi:hypothetical protein